MSLETYLFSSDDLHLFEQNVIDIEHLHHIDAMDESATELQSYVSGLDPLLEQQVDLACNHDLQGQSEAHCQYSGKANDPVVSEQEPDGN